MKRIIAEGTKISGCDSTENNAAASFVCRPELIGKFVFTECTVEETQHSRDKKNIKKKHARRAVQQHSLRSTTRGDFDVARDLWSCAISKSRMRNLQISDVNLALILGGTVEERRSFAGELSMSCARLAADG